MKHLIWFFLVLALTLPGCDNKTEQADAERQARLKNMYRVPPPSDPAENQWANPPANKPKPKEH